MYDITENYLKNTQFDVSFDYDTIATNNVRNTSKEITGWQKNTSASTSVVAATFQYGTSANVSGMKIPAAGFDNTTDGGCLVLWATSSKTVKYQQNVQLPVGRYQLIYSYYNINASATDITNLFGWVPSEGDEVLSGIHTFEYGQWHTDTISFELTGTARGVIQIGVKADAGKTYAALAIDFVKLLRDTPFGDVDVTGDKPTVITDSRFARGATMAFGRMSASLSDGGTITEEGFCWSEHPEPTIDDFSTTTTLENNGSIYWLKNLQPATKYYMRAYAKTAGRNIGYGETIKFYTLPKGQITFTIRTSNDGGNSDRIKAATQTAIDWWNNLTEMKGFSPNIGYNSGVPTAECSYGGWMSVGSNTSYQRPGTIMHEMLHGCGVIPWADTEWSRHNLRSGVTGDGYGTGQWLGDRVTEVLQFWDNNSSSKLNGDYQHMWPYGINGASEDNGSDVLYIGNGLVCQALGEDGLQHTGALFAEPYYALNQEDTIKYYIKNEDKDRGLYSSYMMPSSGKLTWRGMTPDEAAANDSAAWYITFTPNNQYYQFRNAATGQYLSYSSSFKLLNRTTLSSTEDFHLMKGRVNVGTGSDAQRGYWIISPTSNWTPSCLQANANGSVGSGTFNIANSATMQRWLIMTQEEMMEFDKASLASVRQMTTSALKPIKALASIPHTELSEGINQAFSDELSRIDGLLQSATQVSELLPLEKEAVQAAYAFLSNVVATDHSHPFDLTYMITNPGMDATDGWVGTPTLNYSCGEFYQTAFNFYQVINELPSGTYKCAVQGYQRPGTSTDSYNAYAAGTNNVNAFLYAGDKSERLAHIASEARSTKLGGTESTVGGNLYMPNDMKAASMYFAQGLYENKVIAELDETLHSLRIGVRSSSMPDYYWCIFDNFRLYFYGAVGSEQLAIKSIDHSPSTIDSSVYDLQGRCIDKPTRGLYIRNGKKIFIK